MSEPRPVGIRPDGTIAMDDEGPHGRLFVRGAFWHDLAGVPRMSGMWREPDGSLVHNEDAAAYRKMWATIRIAESRRIGARRLP